MIRIYALLLLLLLFTARWRHCRMSSNNNVYNCHLTPDNEPRQTCFRSAPQDSFANRRRFWYVSQKEMRRNEGPVPFISSGGYRALHSGRKALIGQNLIAVSSHCSPLIGQNLIAVSSHCSHYMENSMPYLACSVSRASAGFTEYLIVSNLEPLPLEIVCHHQRVTMLTE